MIAGIRTTTKYLTMSLRRVQAVGVLEVAEPAAQHGVEVGDDRRRAGPAVATRLRPDLVLEGMSAFLAHPPSSAFKTIAEEFEALAPLLTVADVGLVGMQGESPLRAPGLHLAQRGLCFGFVSTEDDKNENQIDRAPTR